VGVELVTAGEAFEDLIFYDLPRLPRPGEELKTDRFARVAGGGVIITAVVAARLGVRAMAVSALSELGRTKLREEGVALRDLRKPKEAPAITAAISTGRERSFVTYNGVNAVLERRLLRQLPRERATHVHCAFYPSRCSRWVRLVRDMQRRGRTVSWDFGWNPPLARDQGFSALLQALDLVFVNEAEAMLYSRRRTLSTALAWWPSASRSTIVKLGPRGAVHLTPQATLRAPAPRVKVVDTTGAGDAFNGGYLAAFVRGRDAATCLREGNKAGAESTTRAGGV